MGSEDVAPRMLKLGARQRWVLGFMLRPLCTLERNTLPVPASRRHSNGAQETGTRADTKPVWTMNGRDKSLSLLGKQTSIPRSSSKILVPAPIHDGNSLIVWQNKATTKFEMFSTWTPFKHTFVVLFNCSRSAQYSNIYRRHIREGGIEPVSRTRKCWLSFHNSDHNCAVNVLCNTISQFQNDTLDWHLSCFQPKFTVIHFNG